MEDFTFKRKFHRKEGKRKGISIKASVLALVPLSVA